MRLSNHLITISLLFAGVVVAIALSFAMGSWIDLYRPIGSRGVLLFLVATAAIFVLIESIAGAAGEWLERRRLHRG